MGVVVTQGNTPVPEVKNTEKSGIHPPQRLYKDLFGPPSRVRG